MNLSRKWLNDFVTVDVNDKDFSEAMTLSGSKVEGFVDLGEEIINVVVGKIVALERHPDSDHMWICQIDIGEEELVQIVTGAWNIHVGDYVPVAKHKSVLPGGKKIRRRSAILKRRIAVRSRPIPKAQPEYFSGSIPAISRTRG